MISDYRNIREGENRLSGGGAFCNSRGEPILWERGWIWCWTVGFAFLLCSIPLLSR